LAGFYSGGAIFEEGIMMELGNLYRMAEKSFEKIIVHIVQPSK